MRMRMNQVAGELKQVYHLSEMKAPDDGIDIIVLPGLWVRHTPDKQTNQCSWLKALVCATDDDTRVFVFKYDIDPVGEVSIWSQLMALSPVLLDAMRQARPGMTQRRSVFFICHGVGGIVLKHSLYLAGEQSAVANATAGIIFLGCPHLTQKNDNRWANWKLILKSSRKDISKNTLSQKDIEQLVLICRHFEQLDIELPVLSVFQSPATGTRRTSMLQNLRGGVEKTLVDRDHATTKALNEELFGVKMTHSEMECILPGTPLFARLVEFFRSASNDGLLVISERLDQLHWANISDTRSTTSRRTEKKSSHVIEGPMVMSPSGNAIPQAKGPTSDIDTSLWDFTKAPRALLLPCYSLRYKRNSGFFGREAELASMDEVLLPITNCVSVHDVPLRSFALCAMGGMGKTEVATEYMYSRKNAFDAIFMISADSEEKLNAGYLDVAQKLGLQEESDRDDPALTRDLVKGWLANPVKLLSSEPTDETSHVRWLLVFDNADDPDILHDYWPSDGIGSVIITSRNPLAKSGIFASSTGIDLLPMPTEDAARFLQKLSLREADPDSLETCQIIAERLGGLPLAIVQMASVVRRQHLSFKEFVEYYDEDPKLLLETAVPGLTYNQTVATVWAIEALSPHAVTLLRILSVLDPDAIPDEILTIAATSVVLEDYPKKKSEYFKAREELIKSSLVTRNPDLGFLKLHRLVQDVVRQKLTLIQLKTTFNAAVTLLGGVWPFLTTSSLHKTSRVRKTWSYYPQVSALRNVLARGFDSTNPSIDFRPDLKVTTLFNEASYAFVQRSFGHIESEAYPALSQYILESHSGEKDEKSFSKLLMECYRFQGIAGIYRKSPVRILNCKKWLSILVDRIQRYQDPVDIKTLPIAYNELGSAFLGDNDFVEAQNSWEMACDGFVAVTDPGELVFAFPWLYRATLCLWTGDPEKGEAILAPILEQREAKLGLNDTSTLESGRALNVMGNIRWKQGRIDEAITFHERALSVILVTYGDRTSPVASACYRLAVDYISAGRKDEARTLLDRVIKSEGMTYWQEGIIARALWKKGKLLQSLGFDEIESEALLGKAMALRSGLVPGDKRSEPELSDEDWDELVWQTFR